MKRAKAEPFAMLLVARKLQAYLKLTRGRAASQMFAGLDVSSASREDDGMRMGNMRWTMNAIGLIALLGCPGIIFAQQDQQGQSQQGQTQQQPEPLTKKEQAPAPTNRLTIEVTGGDSNTPVENASVYVKTIEQHLIKDKKFEVQVKTNQNGTAHVPDAPMGRVKIQVVADGWKPYGRWYDVTDPKQVIKVHLEKPPKWY